MKKIPPNTVSEDYSLSTKRKIEDDCPIDDMAGVNELKQTNRFLESILEHTTTMIAFMDIQFNFIKVNKAYAAADEKEPEFFIGKNHFALYPDSAAEKIFQGVVASGETFISSGRKFEYPDQPNRGVTYWDWSLVPVKDATGQVVNILLSLTNVTERRKLLERLKIKRQRLEALVSELEEKNNELVRFAYLVSHDLRSPLRAIHVMTELIESELDGKNDGEIANNLEVIKGRVKRMDRFIDGLLEYSRIGIKDNTMEEVDLDEVLKGVLDSLNVPQSIIINKKPKFPVIKGVRILLFQLFSNLIANGINFNDKKEGLIDLDFKVMEEGFEFCVGDNGPGIDPNHHERVFEVFQTLNPRDKVESTGIGLSIVKKVIDLHKGTIRIASTPGEGTRFIFWLPEHRDDFQYQPPQI